MSRKKKDARKTLLGDLESIHGLLSETAAESAAAKKAAADSEVPLLDDVVDGATAVDATDPSDDAGGHGLNEDLFAALLGDNWANISAGIVEQAKESIQQQGAEWSPAQIDQLMQALEARIDKTIHDWLRRVVIEQADALHATLQQAISEEITSNMKRLFDNSFDKLSDNLPDNQNSEGADGK